MNQIKLCLRLLMNALRYRMVKLTGGFVGLQSISIELTHRCMCRCVMCNIWKTPRDVKDLSLAELTSLLTSRELYGLREIDLTGGEPFLREDLVSLLTWIGHSKNARFPQLQTIAITTNGILTDKIVKDIKAVIRLLAEQNIELVIVCGLDAVGSLHDEIRNLKKAWEKVSRTIFALKSIREMYGNLIIGVKTTIIPQNVNELDSISEFARDNYLFTIISPRIITSNRFGNKDLQSALSFSAQDIRKMIAFYKGPAFAWNGHREAMVNYLETGTMKKPCSAGFNTVFIRHTGDVFACPLMTSSLGNIKNRPLLMLMTSDTAVSFRRLIGSFQECKICTEPGLERLAWPCEGWTCLKHAMKSWSDFDRLVQHMGIDKFL